MSAAKGQCGLNMIFVFKLCKNKCNFWLESTSLEKGLFQMLLSFYDSFLLTIGASECSKGKGILK